MSPLPNEQGWKDTIIGNSGEITVIRLRFAEQNGGDFPFDATAGPGYVWHCHMLEHEDNEMMRPYAVVAATGGGTQNSPDLTIIVAVAVLIAVMAIGLVIGYVRFRKRSR